MELSAESDNNGLVSATFPFVKSDTDNNLKQKNKKRKGAKSQTDVQRNIHHTDQLNSHEILASNGFRTKLTELTDGFTDVSIEEQHDSQMFANEKGETICIPPDFGSPTHAFHKEVLERCEVPHDIQNEVLSALNCLRDERHQTTLSQKDFFDNTTLDDTQLPSTQLGSNAESDDSLNFEVGVNKQKIFERLIDDKHPWKSITNF